MPTVRLTPAQNRKLRKAMAILMRGRAQKITPGQEIAELADFALRHRALWLEELKNPPRLP
jgi:hypothetical protein